MAIINIDSPIGRLGLREAAGAIVELTFGGYADDELEATSPVLAKAQQQLEEYFKGERRSFDLPLAPVGTDFQQAVWRALQQVDYAKTASYSDIATAIGKPQAVRAVGGANNKNPIPIIIPCHRIIGKSGSLVGYGGGLDIKQFLLDLEQRHAAER